MDKEDIRDKAIDRIMSNITANASSEEVFEILDYLVELPRSKRLAVIHPVIVKMLQADFPFIPKNVINDLIRDIRDEAREDMDLANNEDFIEKTVDRILAIVMQYEPKED